MDESKIDNWQEYGAAAAAAFTLGLLKSVPIEPSPHARELDRQRGLKIFCSYARPDEKFRRELETQLRLLHHSRVVDIWFDRDIDAGDDWRRKIDSNLESADLILLLISADFLSSDYAYGIEMERALRLQRLGQAQVVPVILRDVSLSGLPLGDLQSLPRDGRPISSWKDRDAAWRSVSEGIERIAQQLQGTSQTETSEPLLIDEISLENIRCFESLDLSFRSDLGTRRFTGVSEVRSCCAPTRRAA